MDKPLIFISHSNKDKAYALILEEYIRGAFDNVETFVSSNPAAIQSRDDWEQKVLSRLDEATHFVLVLSQNALESNWVIFEVGYAWKSIGREKIHFLMTSGAEPPGPLRRSQGKSMTDVGELRTFFSALGEDLNREYDPNPYVLRNLADASYENIPRVIQNREFDAWKYHLMNSEWHKADLLSEERSTTAYTCQSDMSFQINHYVESFEHVTFGDWSKGFPDPTSFSCIVDLTYYGSTVTRLQFAHLDAFRNLVPVPKSKASKGESSSSARREYYDYYDTESLEFLVGKRICYFGSGIRNLQEFARQQGIRLLDGPS